MPSYLYSPDMLVFNTATSSSSLSDVTNPILGSPLPIRAIASRKASSIEGSSLRDVNLRIVFTSILFGQKRSLTVLVLNTVRGFSFGVLYGYSIYFKIRSNRKRKNPHPLLGGDLYFGQTLQHQSNQPVHTWRCGFADSLCLLGRILLQIFHVLELLFLQAVDFLTDGFTAFLRYLAHRP